MDLDTLAAPQLGEAAAGAEVYHIPARDAQEEESCSALAKLLFPCLVPKSYRAARFLLKVECCGKVECMAMSKRASRKETRSMPVQNNFCFGCGPDNPQGMHLRFHYDKKHARVTCRVRLDARFAGPPGYAHGGIIATLLDEIMAKLNRLHGVTSVTGHLAVDYLRPVPLGRAIRLEAVETRVNGRRRFRNAEISSERGEILVRGHAIFITVDPRQVFANSKKS